jgi:hypothetical protein
MKKIYFKNLRPLAIFFMVFVSLVGMAQNTWYVNDNSTSGDVYCTAVGNNTTNAANDPSKPSLTLSDALTAAANGDTIYVDAGTWQVLDSTINKGVTIIGAGNGKTIYDAGAPQGNFATIAANNVKISNVQFRSYESGLSNTSSIITVNSNITGIVISNIVINLNGNHSGVGQSLVLQTGSHVTYNNSFTKCNGDISAQGGGVLVNAATLIVNNCVFYNNEFESGDGGAIRILGNSNVTVNNSTFSGNKGQSGGAIGQLGGTLTVTGSCFTNNESTVANSEDGGGAIYVTGNSNTNISNCTFSFNRAANNGITSSTPDGGSFKFHNVTGNASITNCSFSDGFKLLNGTVLNGGLGQDIYYNSATLNITISNNSFSSANSGEVNIFEEGGGNQTMSNNGIYTQSGSTAATTNATPTRTDVAGFSTWTDTNVTGTTPLNLLNGIVAFTPTRTDRAGFGTWTDTDLGGTNSITLLNPTSTSYTPIRIDRTGFSTWTDTSITGTTTMIMLSNTSKIETPILDLSTGNVKTISFTLARNNSTSSTTANVITTSISTDGGSTWTSLGAKSNNATLAVTQTIDISSYSSNNVKIKFESLGATGTLGAVLDDINILKRNTSTTITPTLDFTGHTTKTLNMQIAASPSVAAPKNTITISGSTDNGATWTVLGTRVPALPTLTAITALDLSSLSGSTVKLKFESILADGTIGAQLDNIAITGEAKTSSIISPTMDLTGNTAQVSYLHANIGAVPAKNTVTVSVSKDNGITWTIIGTSNTAGTKTFDLGSNLTSLVKVKFEALAADGTIGASVDDIAIVKASAANAAPVTSCIVTSSITACGASINCATEAIAPVILRCVENKTITVCTGTLPDYTAELSAFDDCSFTVTQSPAQGTLLSTLGNGTHTITFTVSDQSASSPNATCTMTLTLSGCAACSVKTWTAGAWSPAGTPTTSNEVVINDTYNTSTAGHGNIECCKLTVNAGKTLTITSDMYALVVNEVINNGTFTIENNGSLVQQANDKTNTGNINYKRIAAAIKGYDFIYWSSPVTGQDISTIYTNNPVVPQGAKYIWNTTVNNTNGASGNQGQGNWQAASGTMDLAKGYIIRGSSNYAMAATDINTQFVGVPRNGNISYNVARGAYTGNDYIGANGTTITKFDDNHNLIGNPYPSAIKASSFINANAFHATNNPTGQLLGTVKLWQHGMAVSGGNSSPFYAFFTSNYSANDYITINSAGTIPFGGSEIIKSGQGFFVTMIDGTTANGSVNFTNEMRLDSGSTLNNSGFFRTATKSINPKSRIWLDLVNTQNNNCLAKTLIAYIDDATNGYENLYDAVTKFNSSEGLFSKIDNQIYEIQGRAPFVVTDEVPLAFKTINSGNFTLAINAVDGLFLNNQTIYLKDNLLNTIHNLSQSPYNFSALAGENQSRFLIVYQSALNNDNFNNTDVSIFVNEKISIKSKEKIETIEIFDVLGKLIKKYENLSTSEFQDNFSFSNGVYIVKLKTINNNTISQKVIK